MALAVIATMVVAPATWACGSRLPASPGPASAGTLSLWQDGTIFTPIRAALVAARTTVWVEMYEFDRADLADLMVSAWIHRSAGA